MKNRCSFWDTILDIAELIFSPHELLLLIAYLPQLVILVFKIIYQLVANWLQFILVSLLTISVLSSLLPENAAISRDLFGMIKLATIGGTVAMLLLWVWSIHNPPHKSPTHKKSTTSG